MEKVSPLIYTSTVSCKESLQNQHFSKRVSINNSSNVNSGLPLMCFQLLTNHGVPFKPQQALSEQLLQLPTRLSTCFDGEPLGQFCFGPPLPPFSIQCPNKDLITILSRENFTSDNACRKDGTALDLASGDLCLGEILTLQLFFQTNQEQSFGKIIPHEGLLVFLYLTPTNTTPALSLNVLVYS